LKSEKPTELAKFQALMGSPGEILRMLAVPIRGDAAPRRNEFKAAFDDSYARRITV
jgi:hypothetical protein